MIMMKKMMKMMMVMMNNMDDDSHDVVAVVLVIVVWVLNVTCHSVTYLPPTLGEHPSISCMSGCSPPSFPSPL